MDDARVALFCLNEGEEELKGMSESEEVTADESRGEGEGREMGVERE